MIYQQGNLNKYYNNDAWYGVDSLILQKLL